MYRLILTPCLHRMRQAALSVDKILNYNGFLYVSSVFSRVVTVASGVDTLLEY